MTRRHADANWSADLQAHLDQLDADSLRELLLGVTNELEPASYSRLVDAAARRVIGSKGRGALRTPKDASLASDVAKFSKAMKTAGRADPSRLDELLGRLNAAWTRGDHDVFRVAMMDITRALDDGIDLGHDELYSEVLSTDVYVLTRRLLVSVYLTTEPDDRPAKIEEANDAMDVFMATEEQPIAALEAVALEPLPGLDEFARAWAAHLRARVATGQAKGAWAYEQQLREATTRSAGAAGLGDLARSSRAVADFEAWAQALLSAGDPSAAAKAAREGAEAVTDSYHRANLLTLAARIELGRKKSSEPDLRAALLANPSALRLRRWLAGVPSKKRGGAIRDLELATDDDATMVIVHALTSDWPAVAALIATGAPLGWAGTDRGGDAGIDAVVWALAPESKRAQKLAKPSHHSLPGLDDPGAWLEEDLASLDGLVKLPAPTLTELLSQLQPSKPTSSEAKALRNAVSKAALVRVVSIAGRSRRSRYDDAARLVALAAILHEEAGDAKAAASVITKAREATGRKWSFTQAIDDAVAGRSPR